MPSDQSLQDRDGNDDKRPEVHELTAAIDKKQWIHGYVRCHIRTNQPKNESLDCGVNAVASQWGGHITRFGHLLCRIAAVAKQVHVTTLRHLARLMNYE